MSAEQEEAKLAGALLRAAREDQPSPAFVRSVMSTLGLGSGFFVASQPLTPAAEGGALRPLTQLSAELAKPLAVEPCGLAAASSGGASVTLGAILKAVGLGVLAGAAALGTTEFTVQRTGGAARSVIASVPSGVSFSVVARRTPPPSVAPGTANAEAPDESHEPSQRRAPRIQSLQARAANAATSSVEAKFKKRGAEASGSEVREAEIPKAETPASSALAEEVALLRRASSALESGNAHAALQFLDQYTNERNTAFLVPEATLLRAKALVAIGQSAAAADVAREFLGARSGARQSAALKALVEGTDVAP